MYTGLIYQIVADETDKVYFGSTTTSLKQRFKHHKAKANKTFSKEILQYANARIELIETCINDDKDLLKKELLDIESEYIIRCREIKPNKCVNQQIPNRIFDLNKRKEFEKQYRQTEKRKEYIKQYNQKNKEKILEQNKLNLRKYRLNNPEKFKEYEKKRVRNKKSTEQIVQAYSS